MKTQSFRRLAKERMQILLPGKLAGAVRHAAIRRRTSISALIAVAAARDLGLDPETFGISPAIKSINTLPETPQS